MSSPNDAKVIAERIVETNYSDLSTDDLNEHLKELTVESEILARAYLNLETKFELMEETAKGLYSREEIWASDIDTLKSEIAKLKEENSKLREQRDDLLVDEYGVKKSYHYEQAAELDEELERLRMRSLRKKTQS